MPPLPAVPDVIHLKISGTYHDAKWLNQYFVQYSGGAPSASDLASYLLHLNGGMVTDYTDEMSVDNEVTLLEATDLASSTGATASRPVTSAFGVRTGDFMPAQVAMVGSLTITRRYRGGHPRKYLPWGTAGTMASGSTIDWDSGFVADCVLKFDDVLAQQVGLTVGSTNLLNNVNVSYVNAGARRTSAVVDIVTGAVIKPRICNQRRRLGKVGG